MLARRIGGGTECVCDKLLSICKSAVLLDSLDSDDEVYNKMEHLIIACEKREDEIWHCHVTDGAHNKTEHLFFFHMRHAGRKSCAFRETKCAKLLNENIIKSMTQYFVEHSHNLQSLGFHFIISTAFYVSLSSS